MNTHPKAYLTVGISASGKTTWAKAHAKATGARIVSRDDIRFAITGLDDFTDYKFNGENEKLVTAIQNSMIKDITATGADIIIADTNLNKKVRNKLITKLETFGYEVVIVAFPINLNNALDRDSTRSVSVGEVVIQNQWVKWVQFMEDVQEIDEKTRVLVYIPEVDLTHSITFC